MAVTRTQLHDLISFLLNEDAATAAAIAEVGAGDGSAYSTNEEGYDELLTQAAWEMARQCVYIPGEGAVTQAALSQTATLSDIGAVNIAHEKLWGIARLSFNGVFLRRTTLDGLAAANPSYLYTDPGTPTHYWVEGDAVGLWPKPAASATLRIYGPAMMRRIGASSPDVASWSWATEDALLWCLPRRAGAILAERRLDDPETAPRYGVWQQEYVARGVDLFRHIPSTIRNQFYQDSPYSVMARMAASGRK